MAKFNAPGWEFDPERSRTRMHQLGDEDLLTYLDHAWQVVRDAARAEAAARWAETIMPKDA
jgi:hypothetical protein